MSELRRHWNTYLVFFLILINLFQDWRHTALSLSEENAQEGREIHQFVDSGRLRKGMQYGE